MIFFFNQVNGFGMCLASIVSQSEKISLERRLLVLQIDILIQIYRLIGMTTSTPNMNRFQ